MKVGAVELAGDVIVKAASDKCGPTPVGDLGRNGYINHLIFV